MIHLDFAQPVMDMTADPNGFVFLYNVFNGISEGGKIIMGMIVLLGLGLFFFGRVGAKKLNAIVEASIEAAKEAREAKTQAKQATFAVTNSHSTHVRDDIDNNQKILMEKLEALVASVSGIKSDIGGIRSEIREDRKNMNELASRVNGYIDKSNGV